MQIIARIASLVSVALVTICSSGCFNYLRPDLGPPGTIGAQRSRMVLNDPYPSDYLGPTIQGGRPLGFDLPLPEAQNNQYSPYSELNKANLSLFQRLRSNRQFGNGYGLGTAPYGYQGGYAPGYGGVSSPGILYTPNVNPVVIHPGTSAPGVVNPGAINPAGVINPGGVVNPGAINPGVINSGSIAVPPGYLPPGN